MKMSEILPKRHNKLQIKSITKSSRLQCQERLEWKVPTEWKGPVQIRHQSVPPMFHQETQDIKDNKRSLIWQCLSYMGGIINQPEQHQQEVPPQVIKQGTGSSFKSSSFSSVAQTMVISEATMRSDKTEIIAPEKINLSSKNSDLLTDNLSNVGKPADISEFNLNNEARGTKSDPMELSSDNTSSNSSSKSLGKSYGSIQYSRGKFKHFLRFLKRKNYDEDAYEKKVEERIQEHQDYINKD